MGTNTRVPASNISVDPDCWSGSGFGILRFVRFLKAYKVTSTLCATETKVFTGTAPGWEPGNSNQRVGRQRNVFDCLSKKLTSLVAVSLFVAGGAFAQAPA